MSIKKNFHKQIGTWQWLMSSKINRKIYEKSYGYSGDCEVMDLIYTAVSDSPGIGYYFDECLYNSPACKAVRNRKDYVISLICSEIQKRIDAIPRIFNLGSGPGRDMKELLEKNYDLPLIIYNIDRDIRALEYAKKVMNGSFKTSVHTVNSALSLGVSNVDLNKIKRIGVVLGTSQAQTGTQAPVFKMGDDLTMVMSDNIALELMKLGFEIVERSSLNNVLDEQKLQISGLTDPATAAKVGKILGIDAIVLGTVTTSQKYQTGGGFMGIGADVTMASVVSNATMKIVGVDRGTVLTIVALSYKKGQKPTEAAKTMAIALSQVIKGETIQKTTEK